MVGSVAGEKTVNQLAQHLRDLVDNFNAIR